MRTGTKQYIRPIPVSYWFTRRAYVLFMLRELSSAFIGGYAIFLMIMMAKARDAESFRALLESLKSPLSILLHLIVLGFALYHTITYFNITPRVLVIPRGEDRVPDQMIVGVHYAAWAVVSLILFIIAIRA